MPARLQSLWKVEFAPSLFLLVATGISWLVTTSVQPLPSSLYHLLLCMLTLPLGLFCDDTCPTQIIQDYRLISESLNSPHPHRLDPVKWHSEVQGSSMISLRTTIQTTTRFPRFQNSNILHNHSTASQPGYRCWYDPSTLFRFPTVTWTHLLLCALIPFSFITCVMFMYPPLVRVVSSSPHRYFCCPFLTPSTSLPWTPKIFNTTLNTQIQSI